MTLPFALAVLASALGAETATISDAPSAASDEDTIIVIDDSPTATTAAIPTAPLGPTIFGAIKARASMRFDARVGVDTSFDREGEQVGELWLTGRLELDVELSEHWAFYTAPRFDYANAISRDGDDRQFVYALFPEAQVTYKNGPLLIRGGALIFGWGSSDLVSPVDVLNPIDLRRSIFGLGQDAKIPVLAAEVVGSFGPLTLRGVVQPFFTPSRFFVAGWDFSVLEGSGFPGASALSNGGILDPAFLDQVGDLVLVTERPRDRPDNATLAARATFTHGPLDISASAIHGWDTLPRLILDNDLVLIAGAFASARAEGRPPPWGESEVIGAFQRIQRATEDGRDLLRGSYLRRDLVGLDGTYALDPFVLKFDLAYTFKRTFYGWDFQPTTVAFLSAVAGVEYFYGDSLQVILEGFVLTAIDIDSNLRMIYFEANTPPPSMFIGGKRTVAVPGVVGLVRYNLFDGDLHFELAAGGTLTRGDLLLLPSVGIRLDDYQELAVGGALLEGQSDSYGGINTNVDNVYVSYKLSY